MKIETLLPDSRRLPRWIALLTCFALLSTTAWAQNRDQEVRAAKEKFQVLLKRAEDLHAAGKRDQAEKVKREAIALKQRLAKSSVSAERKERPPREREKGRVTERERLLKALKGIELGMAALKSLKRHEELEVLNRVARDVRRELGEGERRERPERNRQVREERRPEQRERHTEQQQRARGREREEGREHAERGQRQPREEGREHAERGQRQPREERGRGERAERGEREHRDERERGENAERREREPREHGERQPRPDRGERVDGDRRERVETRREEGGRRVIVRTEARRRGDGEPREREEGARRDRREVEIRREIRGGGDVDSLRREVGQLRGEIQELRQLLRRLMAREGEQ